MAEFKKLSDVEVVAEPAESANVLIEEDGVIKKAPKTAVGGASGEADMVIAISTFFFNPPTDLIAEQFSIESGSLESVKDALVAGNTPVVKVRYYCDDYGDGTSVASSECLCGVRKYGDYMSFYYININGQHTIFMNLIDSNYISYQFTPWAYSSGGTVF